jgi:hypothetical protein
MITQTTKCEEKKSGICSNDNLITDNQTERRTDSQTYRRTDREVQPGRETYRQIKRRKDGRQTYRQAERCTDR